MPPTAPPSPVADRPARASRPERVRVARGAGRLIRIVNTNARAAKAALQAGAEPDPTQTHAESGD